MMAMNSSGRLMLMSTPGRSTSQASGITTSPATSACIMPAMTFSIAIQGDIDRRKQTVFDLARPLKFRDQRHAYRPDSGEDHADGNNARQQQALVSSPACSRCRPSRVRR